MYNFKLGIFCHFGPYSIPGWSEHNMSAIEKIRNGSSYVDIPDPCFYHYNLKQPDSQTKIYHDKTYGENYSYDEFAKEFKNRIKTYDVKDITDVIIKSRAEFSVLTTKHQDGFQLWDSNVYNPNDPSNIYRSDRDFVKDFSEELRKNNIKFGVYYSGGIDWTFKMDSMENFVDAMLAIPLDQDYADYVKNQWDELMNRYDPDIVWNDIGIPYDIDVNDFYKQNIKCIINDRFFYPNFGNFYRYIMSFNLVKNCMNYFINWFYPSNNPLPNSKHSDFYTIEYGLPDNKLNKSWQVTRALGNSFGYNKLEVNDDLMTSKELINYFVKIVSRGGNLLLNISPDGHGKIPEIQVDRINDLGKWLEFNGEGIFGTTQYMKSESIMMHNRLEINVYFTCKDDKLFIFIQNIEKVTSKYIIIDIDSNIKNIRMLNKEKTELKFTKKFNHLIVEIPPCWPDINYKVNMGCIECDTN